MSSYTDHLSSPKIHLKVGPNSAQYLFVRSDLGLESLCCLLLFHRTLKAEVMKRSSSTREPARKLNGENFITKVISPAICGETCPICLRELEDRTAAVLTTCIHAYCISCIRKWSNLKRTCPLCNAQFDSWFTKINLSSQSFRKERLTTSNCSDKLKVGVGSSQIDARGCVFSGFDTSFW